MDAFFEEQQEYIRSELEFYENSSPDVISLAILACAARKIEPELLRALRLELADCFPAHRKPHVGTEFALWFSSLVENRGSDSISLLPQVSEILRGRLRDEYSKHIETIRRIIRKCHASVPPVIAWEEDLIYYSLTSESKADFDARVGEKILEAASAVKSGESEGLDEWINRMYVRIPERLSENEDFKKLVAVSQQQIILKTELADASRNFPASGDAMLKIKRGEDKLEIGKTVKNADFQISVPNLSPLRLTLRGSDDKIYIIPDGQTIKIPLNADEDSLLLETADGRIYRIPIEEDAISGLLHEAEINQSTELNLSSEKTGKKLTSSELRELMPRIRRLKNLASLDLSFNNLTDIDFLAELVNLPSISLMGNQISDAAPLGELKSLAWVNLSENQITDASFLERLESLLTLNLNANPLRDFSPFKKLRSLTALFLSRTGIEDASFLTELRDLTTLELIYNRITDASFVKDLKQLRWLHLTGNSELKLPAELAKRVLDRQGIEEIIRYYEQLETEEQDYIREAKVLIIGESGAGKTDLFRRLLNPNYFLPDVSAYAEPVSGGINIETIEFQYDRDLTFKAHLWDFGGQEIHQTLHRYFFTRRSLYILVTDDRTEPHNLDKWLEMIALHGAGSPVMVVFNEKYSTVKNYDLKIQRKEFGRMISSIDERSVNIGNEGDDRFIDLINTIKNKLTNLKHVKQPVPKSRVRVREELLYIREAAINVDRYQGICRENGIENIKQAAEIAEFLNDLGIIFDFRTDEYFQNPVILKPKWLTDALYRILGDSRIINNGGRFTTGQAFDLWWEYEADEKLVLLNLMLKGNLELAYKLEGTETYVVPRLLPESAPEYRFDETNAVQTHFAYKFKPKGIVSRLIVRLHEYIVFDEQTSEQIVWRSGVLLKRNNSTALIVEYTENRYIAITVSGDNSDENREFIAIIGNEIKRIHRVWFENRLQFEEKIEDAATEEPLSEVVEMMISERQALVDEVSSKMNAGQRELMEFVANETLFRVINSKEHSGSDMKTLWPGDLESSSWETKIKYALQFIPVRLSIGLEPDEFISRFTEWFRGGDESPGTSFEEENFNE